MRWMLLDRIEAFKPWASIQGRKGVSLEEYLLLDPLGRRGAFPETLIIEACVHLSRWLVNVSSDFSQGCIVTMIENFSFEHEIGTGAVLDISLEINARDEQHLTISCRVSCEGRPAVSGNLELDLLPLPALDDPEKLRLEWEELYGAA